MERRVRRGQVSLINDRMTRRAAWACIHNPFTRSLIVVGARGAQVSKHTLERVSWRARTLLGDDNIECEFMRAQQGRGVDK